MQGVKKELLINLGISNLDTLNRRLKPSAIDTNINRFNDYLALGPHFDIKASFDYMGVGSPFVVLYVMASSLRDKVDSMMVMCRKQDLKRINGNVIHDEAFMVKMSDCIGFINRNSQITYPRCVAFLDLLNKSIQRDTTGLLAPVLEDSLKQITAVMSGEHVDHVFADDLNLRLYQRINGGYISNMAKRASKDTDFNSQIDFTDFNKVDSIVDSLENTKVERQGLYIKLTSLDGSFKYGTVTHNPLIKTGVIVSIRAFGYHHVTSHKADQFIGLLKQAKSQLLETDPQNNAIDTFISLIAKL